MSDTPPNPAARQRFGIVGSGVNLTMAAAQWQRIKTIVFDAVARDPSIRSAFIAEACAGDAALMSEVSSLVDAMEQVGDRFETPGFDVGTGGPALQSLLETPIIGSLVGPYRVVRELGRGGMGAVYLAERADGEFEQHVAIKFVAGSVSSARPRRAALYPACPWANPRS